MTQPNPVLPLYRFAVLAPLLCLGASACAHVVPMRPQQWDEKVVSRSEKELVLNDENHFGGIGTEVKVDQKRRLKVAQDGDRLTVEVIPLCKRLEYLVVERSGTAEYENQTPAYDWVWGGLGVASAGVSAGFFVDASRTHSSDENAREFNEAGPTVPIAVGVTTGVIALGLLAIPIVDGIRAAGSEPQQETDQRKNVTEPEVICKQRHVLPTEISVEQPAGSSISLGITGDDNRLVVRLSDHVPMQWAKTAFGRMGYRVHVDQKFATPVDMDPVFAVFHDRLWARTNVARCAKAKRRIGCADVRAYLADYPASKHAPRARQLLSDVREREHDAAWAKSAPCKNPQRVDACEGVQEYLAAHPDGRHAKRAKQMLASAEPKIKALEANIKAREEREEKARLAREEREEKARLAREAREEKARARREAREAKLQIAQEKRGCLKSCNKKRLNCWQSCSGLNTVERCRRGCRREFESCELQCARRARESALDAPQPRRARRRRARTRTRSRGSLESRISCLDRCIPCSTARGISTFGGNMKRCLAAFERCGRSCGCSGGSSSVADYCQ